MREKKNKEFKNGRWKKFEKLRQEYIKSYKSSLVKDRNFIFTCIVYYLFCSQITWVGKRVEYYTYKTHVWKQAQEDGSGETVMGDERMREILKEGNSRLAEAREYLSPEGTKGRRAKGCFP